MGRLVVSRVTTASDMGEALSVRRRVFIEEQGVPEELEIDEHDADPATVSSALHVVGRLDGAAVATGRLLDDGHIGRIAVLAEHRRTGFGREIMLSLHAAARERGFATVTLGAQLQAMGFYETLGYVARGDVFLDAGIEHRWMDCRLG